MPTAAYPVASRGSSFIGRLTRRADFLAAAGGRRFHSPRMTVQGRFRDAAVADGGLRLGFTVTKRVGNAPERNRIRRRLRAAVDGVAGHAGLAADIVVIARRDLLSTPFSELVADLDRAIATVARSPDAGRGRRRPEPETRSHG